MLELKFIIYQGENNDSYENPETLHARKENGRIFRKIRIFKKNFHIFKENEHQKAQNFFEFKNLDLMNFRKLKNFDS